MKIKDNSILCFGEVLWDRLPSEAKPGGAPLNVAIHLNANGLNASIASSVGNDEAGTDLLKFIEDSGLSSELIQRSENLPTSEVLVHLDAENNASYEICEPVAWDNIVETSSLIEKVKNSGLLIYGSLASRNDTTRSTLLRLLQENTLKLIDVNLRKPYDKKDVLELLLPKSDIVKLNDIELNEISQWYDVTSKDKKELVKWFANQFKIDMTCLTKGEKGALLYTNNTFYEHPGFKIKAEDTVGAGDAFLAGLVASFIQNKTPDKALAFACATGAFVASKAGATPTYDMAEINRILAQ